MEGGISASRFEWYTRGYAVLNPSFPPPPPPPHLEDVVHCAPWPKIAVDVQAVPDIFKLERGREGGREGGRA